MQFPVKQHTEPCESILLHSDLRFLVPFIPSRFECIDRHQPRLAIFVDLCVGRITPGTLSAAQRSHHSGPSASSMLLFSSRSAGLSSSHSFSLSFGLSKSPCRSSQFWVSEMLSGALSWTLSAVIWLIHWMQRTFITSVRPLERTFADKAGGKRDHSDNLNAAAVLCWKFD